MKFSPFAAFLTLLVTAQAGPVLLTHDGDALESRSVADLFGALSVIGARSREAATVVASAEAPQTGGAENIDSKKDPQGTAGTQQAAEKQAKTNDKTAVEAAINDKATAAGAADPATVLQGVSDALKLASTTVDKAITDLGETGNAADATNAGKSAAGEAQAAGEKGATKGAAETAGNATDATASKGAGNATDVTASKDAAKGALTKAAGGAVVAKTADGLLLPDGRIGQNIVETDFNVVSSVFKSAVVKGEGLVFSDIITFPGTTPSIFDVAGNTKALEININDSSIFTPQGGEPQTQFRRADLLPSIISTANSSSTTGKRTMHFSIQQDPAKPLALTTNEYQLAFLETADFESRTFDVRVGTGTTGPSLDGKNIVVFGRSGAAIKEMFVAPFSTDLQNFAVTLDFDQNTMQVFHSTGATPLAQVSEAAANDNSGNGEYHFALLKLADAQGQQAAGIDEGIVFSGIFMEDSSDGTVTLQ